MTRTLRLAAAAVIAATFLYTPAKGADMATASPEKGFLMRSVRTGETSVKYVVYVPPIYEQGKPMPAIVFLNGAGECGTDGLKQIAVGLGPAVMFDVDHWPFIVIFPQKQDVRHGWEDEDAMVMDTLQKCRKDYGIDGSRIYLTGLSQGGHGTWTIAAKHPSLFAAIAPVCGWADQETAKKLAGVPAWVFHGDADQAVKVQSSRDMAKWLEESGGSPKLTIYPGVGHNSWDNAYRNEKLYEWFLQHKR
jgi:predicted peptidase